MSLKFYQLNPRAEAGKEGRENGFHINNFSKKLAKVYQQNPRADEGKEGRRNDYTSTTSQKKSGGFYR